MVEPKQISVVLKSEKQKQINNKKIKKKKKKVLSLFCNFSTFHFHFFTFPFTIFLPFFSIFTPFPFFPCLFFPGRSAEISRSEVSGGHSAPCPPPVTPLRSRIKHHHSDEVCCSSLENVNINFLLLSSFSVSFFTFIKCSFKPSRRHSFDGQWRNRRGGAECPLTFFTGKFLLTYREKRGKE